MSVFRKTEDPHFWFLLENQPLNATTDTRNTAQPTNAPKTPPNTPPPNTRNPMPFSYQTTAAHTTPHYTTVAHHTTYAYHKVTKNGTLHRKVKSTSPTDERQPRWHAETKNEKKLRGKLPGLRTLRAPSPGTSIRFFAALDTSKRAILCPFRRQNENLLQ